MFRYHLVIAYIGSLSIITVSISAQPNDRFSSRSGTTQCVDRVTVDYYQPAYKLYGTALRAALHNIIKGHTVISYDGLYDAFPTTDTKPNGKVWDIYSDIPGGTPAYEYTHGVKKCGNYSQEGDCYNREHSWCESWLGATAPARSDLFHMYPTDGYVNNRRSNYNFGTVSSATWTSTNGSKVGANTYPGYSGVVFEPINAYKGDLARSAMYMSCRYYLEDAAWSTSPGTNKSDLLLWYSNLLYDWHLQDTVSAKEINRNNAIETFQHNRNPFIDHPEFAAEIWKTTMSPAVLSITEVGSKSFVVDFSRVLDSTSAMNVQNFICTQSSISPSAIQYGVDNDFSKIRLSFPALSTGTAYSLRILNQKSLNAVVMSDTTINFTTSGPSDAKEIYLEKCFSLYQNFPNPFNPATEIRFSLSHSGMVSLRVYDMMGSEVANLINGWQEAGSHSVRFDGTALPSGIYYYKFVGGNFTETKKMTIIK